ncbi:MAG: hypothetical protein ACK4IT_07925 [Thioalkalivibrionaceae bacterium]
MAAAQPLKPTLVNPMATARQVGSPAKPRVRAVDPAIDWLRSKTRRSNLLFDLDAGSAVVPPGAERL